MDIWTTGCMKKSCWRGSTSQCGRDWAETWLRWEKCGPTKTKVSFQNMAEVCVESEWCRNSLIFIVSSSDLKKSMWWLGLEVLHEKIIELDQAISVVKLSVLCLAAAMNRPTVHDAPNTSSLWVYLRMFVWTWWGFSVALGNGLVWFLSLGSSAGAPSDSSELWFLHCDMQRWKVLGKKIQWDQVTGTRGIKSSSGHFCSLE